MKILSTKTVYTSKYFNVTQKTIERNGKTFTKDFIEKTPIVLVIPYTANEIYMESQFRASLDQVVLEVVAGNIEIGEAPLESAKRELKGEAGLIAKRWEKIAEWNLSANLSAKIHVFAATDLEEGKQKLDDDEEITIMKLPMEEVLEKIETGEMTVSYQIAGLLLFDRLRKEGKL